MISLFLLTGKPMKKYFLVFLLACYLSHSAFAQEFTKIDEAAFKPGEKLSYKLKYGFFTAAEANIRVEESPLKFEGQARLPYHRRRQNSRNF